MFYSLLFSTLILQSVDLAGANIYRYIFTCKNILLTTAADDWLALNTFIALMYFFSIEHTEPPTKEATKGRFDLLVWVRKGRLSP